MSKEEFFEELEKRLKQLPKEERENAIIYYKEYFEDAGEDKTQDVIKKLGTPAEVASQIMGDFIVKETEKNEEKGIKRSFSNAWVVMIFILASPIALPIAIVAITLIFITWILISSLWLVGIIFVLTGILSLLVFMPTLIGDIPTAILIAGYGMLLLGLGLAITIGTKKLFIKYTSWITSKTSKILLKRRKQNEE